MTGTPGTGGGLTEAPKPTEHPQSNVTPVVSGANAEGGAQSSASSSTGGAVTQSSATGSMLNHKKKSYKVIINFIMQGKKGIEPFLRHSLVNCNSCQPEFFFVKLQICIQSN